MRAPVLLALSLASATAAAQPAPRLHRAHAPGDHPLRDAPTRAEVLRAMRAIQPRLRACRGAPRPVVQGVVIFASSGRVMRVELDDSIANTPVGNCLEARLRAVVLRPFLRPQFSVSYPFVLPTR